MRLLLTWEFNAHWQPDASAPSEIEITFVAEGPGRTRVELEHRHFERMGKDGGEKWSCLFDSLPPVNNVKVAVV